MYLGGSLQLVAWTHDSSSGNSYRKDGAAPVKAGALQVLFGGRCTMLHRTLVPFCLGWAVQLKVWWNYWKEESCSLDMPRRATFFFCFFRGHEKFSCAISPRWPKNLFNLFLRDSINQSERSVSMINQGGLGVQLGTAMPLFVSN